MIAATPTYPPSCNTGGVSLSSPPYPGGVAPFESSSKTKIDTFSFTSRSSIKHLHDLIEAHVEGVEISAGKPPRNYPVGAKIELNGQRIGWTGCGAPHGMNLVYVDGAGCRRIAKHGFASIESAIASLDAVRYTRVDIASDTFEGQVGPGTILAAYEGDGFKVGRSKKNPMLRTVESRDPEGRPLGSTIYIGAPDAAKRVCAYEKGLQLFGKNPASNITKAAMAKALKSVPGQLLVEQLGEKWKELLDGWFRVEIRYFHDKDRPLPRDMLTRPDHFFAGAYPICELLLPDATPQRPLYIPDDAEAKLLVQLRACRASYGGLLRTLSDRGLDPQTIFDLLVGDKPSRKLREAGIDNVEEFVSSVLSDRERGL